MGTDNVELLDRRTAEIIVRGSETDLIALVESRTRPLVGPPVWRDYWEPNRQSLQEFAREATVEERFKVILSGETGLTDIKSQLIRDLCTSDWLSLDYWGCMAEVFGGVEPPGSTKWEDFVAPMFEGSAPQPVVHRDDDGTVQWVENSGRYLLTVANLDAMIQSLRNRRLDLRIMGESEVGRLERWRHFCARHHDFCVVYQIDF